MSTCTSALSEELNIEVLSKPVAPEFVLSNIAICNETNSELTICIQDYPADFDMVQIVDEDTGTILVEENSLCFDISFLLNTNQNSLELSAIVVSDNCFSDNSESINIELANVPSEIFEIEDDTIILCNLESVSYTHLTLPTICSV